jgi:hypothetical protein
MSANYLYGKIKILTTLILVVSLSDVKIMYMILLFVHSSTPSTFIMKKGDYPVDNDSLSYGTLY